MRWRRAAWALPVSLFLATFGVFSVRHPGSVKAMLTSAQGLATTAAVVVVVAVFLAAARVRPAIARVAPFVLSAGVLGGAVYAEVPFERTSTQNRTLVAEPIADAVPTTTTVTTAPARADAPPTTAAPTRALQPNPPTTAAPQAVRHSTGTLAGINHSASGSVSIIESSAGDYVIRFENFTVQGSPAPVLYVLEGDDKHSPGGTKLGAFTATNGTLLDVPLPAGVRPGAGWTVLIWCEKFATPIANSTQR